MIKQSKQGVELQIHRLKNLPALPEASVRILEAINDPDIAIEKLADVLSLSPGLLARLLGLANSAYFGKTREISDIRTAIVQVLGLELVKSLALGVVVNVQFDTSKCRGFDTEYFWTRSLATAVIGQKLASNNGFQSYSLCTVYNCGLLLNIGMLVVAFLFTDELNAIFFRCQQPDSAKVGDEIVHRLGWSHYQLGFQLMRKWQLSSVYQSVLQHFDSPDQSANVAELIELLQVSQKISSTVVTGNTLDEEAVARLAVNSGLSAQSIAEVFNELQDNIQDIQQMAQVMGG